MSGTHSENGSLEIKNTPYELTGLQERAKQVNIYSVLPACRQMKRRSEFSSVLF